MTACVQQLRAIKASCGAHWHAQEITSELHAQVRRVRVPEHFARQIHLASVSRHVFSDDSQETGDTRPDAAQFGATPQLNKVRRAASEESCYIGHVTEPEIKMTVHPLQRGN